jgi:4-methoxybenzoate monooxygenase (O-demethylating)
LAAAAWIVSVQFFMQALRRLFLVGNWLNMADAIPALDIDPFSDELLTDPYAYYHVLRDVGPVFSLPKYATLGIARFDHVQAALKDWQHLTSSEGPGFNDPFNSQLKATVVALDPPDHKDVRSVMVRRLRLRLGRLREVAPLADQVSAELFDTLGDPRAR